jgi:hypothetical protein
VKGGGHEKENMKRRSKGGKKERSRKGRNGQIIKRETKKWER